MSPTAEPDVLLPVGVIGLGDIAQKAYLPVLTALPGLDLRLMTRDGAKLDRIGDTHRIPAEKRFTDLGQLIGSGIRAAFVHAATDQHVPIVEQLLTAGVDVYVDKPLDYTLDGSRHLVDLADRTGRSLMVGFNRRFVPANVQAKERPRDLITLRKNREGLPEAARPLVFDDFIHVVDTLRFLVPGDIDHVDVRARVHEGLVEHVVLTLARRGLHRPRHHEPQVRLHRGDPRSLRRRLQARGPQPRRRRRPPRPAHRPPPRRLGSRRPPARHRTGRPHLPRRRPHRQDPGRPRRPAHPRTLRTGRRAHRSL